MSQNDGTSTKPKPYYQEVNGWKDIATMGNKSIKNLFALHDLGYEMVQGLQGSMSKKGKQKLFLAILDSGALIIKYRGRDQAALISEHANLDMTLDPTTQQGLEKQARIEGAGVDALVDCGVFVATLAIGFFTGGIGLAVGGMLGGFVSAAKCGLSATKYFQLSNGAEKTILDTDAGKIMNAGVSALDAVNGVKSAFKTGKQAFTYMKMARNTMVLPNLATHAGYLFKARLLKFGVVELMNVTLDGYDLLTKWNGLPAWNVQEFLNNQAATISVQGAFVPTLRPPTDWLRDINAPYFYMPGRY